METENSNSRRSFLKKSTLLSTLSFTSGWNVFAAVDKNDKASLVVTNDIKGAISTNNWYEDSFYMLHLDHHTNKNDEVGKDADPVRTSNLLKLSQPDVIQIHAKGAPGWTTYPSEIGHTPPKLARDVQQVWHDIAKKDGYNYCIYYNIGRDEEIMKTKPEWNRKGPEGKLRDRALCYSSGVAENYLWPMIEELMDKYQPQGLWFDGSCFTVRTSYNANCLNRFRSEQQMEPPRNAQQNGWPEWKEMHRQIYREFIRDTSALIKKKDPGCRVVFNFAYGLLMPEHPGNEVDNLTGDRGAEIHILSADAHWYDSLQKPFDLMTRIFLHRNDRKEVKPKEQVEQEMAIIIANGGKYFAWDSPTIKSALQFPMQDFVGKTVAPFLRARQAYCQHTTRKADISLLNAKEDHYQFSYGDELVFKRVDRRTLEPTEALARLHLNYEYISDYRLQQFDIQSPALLINNPVFLNPANIEKIKEYAAGGGIVIWTGTGFAEFGLEEFIGATVTPETTDARVNLSVHEEIHSFGLKTPSIVPHKAKVVVEGYDSNGKAYPLLLKNHHGKSNVYSIPFTIFTSTAPTPDFSHTIPLAVISHIFEAISPLEERAVYINGSPFVEVVLRENKAANRYVLHLVNRAFGDREATGESGNPEYRITNIPPVMPCPISVKLPGKPLRVTLQPQNEEVSGWSYKKGRLEAVVPAFEIHQMLTIEYTNHPNEKYQDTEMVEVYPNPATESIKITSKSELFKNNVHLKLFDLFGTMVGQWKFEVTSIPVIELPVGDFPRGSYILHIFKGQMRIMKHIILK